MVPKETKKERNITYRTLANSATYCNSSGGNPERTYLVYHIHWIGTMKQNVHYKTPMEKIFGFTKR